MGASDDIQKVELCLTVTIDCKIISSVIKLRCRNALEGNTLGEQRVEPELDKATFSTSNTLTEMPILVGPERSGSGAIAVLPMLVLPVLTLGKIKKLIHICIDVFSVEKARGVQHKPRGQALETENTSIRRSRKARRYLFFTSM